MSTQFILDETGTWAGIPYKMQDTISVLRKASRIELQGDVLILELPVSHIALGASISAFFDQRNVPAIAKGKEIEKGSWEFTLQGLRDDLIDLGKMSVLYKSDELTELSIAVPKRPRNIDGDSDIYMAYHTRRESHNWLVESFFLWLIHDDILVGQP